MSNTKILKVKGTAYWAKVFPDHKDVNGYDNELTATGGQYVVNMDLDEDSIEALTMAHSQAVDYPKVIEDNEGNEVTTYKFKRFHEKYSRDGKLLEWASGAPRVEWAGGKAYDFEESGIIGNGSVLELTVAVYKAGRNYGTRLEKVTVLDHVEVKEDLVA